MHIKTLNARHVDNVDNNIDWRALVVAPKRIKERGEQVTEDHDEHTERGDQRNGAPHATAARGLFVVVTSSAIGRLLLGDGRLLSRIDVARHRLLGCPSARCGRDRLSGGGIDRRDRRRGRWLGDWRLSWRFGWGLGSACSSGARNSGGDATSGSRTLAGDAVGASEIAPKVISEVVGSGVPVGRTLGQQLHGDRLERLGDLDPALDEAVGTLLHMLVGDSDRGLGLERRHAGEHLVEHHAQRVEVGTAVERLALGLLRREVRGGPHDRSVLSEGRITAAHKGGGNAEVGDLHVAAVRNEDVAELDVTVDEACGMGGAERSGDIGSDLSGAVGMQWSGGAQDIGHRPARHVLHHDVVRAPLLPPVVDADDVRMVEVCGSLSLTTEALDKVRIVCELGEQHLERDLATE